MPEGNLKILQTIYYKNSNFKLDLIFMKIALLLRVNIEHLMSEGIFYVLYNLTIVILSTCCILVLPCGILIKLDSLIGLKCMECRLKDANVSRILSKPAYKDQKKLLWHAYVLHMGASFM